jgi:pectin methylesterase-like acyl-CoA thioesterase
MRRTVAALATLTILAGPPAASAKDEHVLAVPTDYPTIEAALATAAKGDVILLAAGTYDGGITVPEDKPGITIRGVNRNTVVFAVLVLGVAGLVILFWRRRWRAADGVSPSRG